MFEVSCKSLYDFESWLMVYRTQALGHRAICIRSRDNIHLIYFFWTDLVNQSNVEQPIFDKVQAQGFVLGRI